MKNELPKQWTIAAFYRFVTLEDYKKLQTPIAEFCRAHGIVGTILLAHEGINSTLAGSDTAVKAFFEFLEKDARFKGIERKYSYSAEQPFKRMKVKLKKEIVRLNVADLDIESRGEYLNAKEWDKLLEQPDVLVIDTRNDYEVAIGKFKDAIDPETRNFTDLPEWVDKNLKGKEQMKIAMYCTGGIRCEKSTALLKQKGFNNVFHLKGGILQYLEDTNNAAGKWEGECFVFDERVAVDEHLKPTGRVVCVDCGMPRSEQEAPQDKNGKAHCLKCEFPYRNKHLFENQ